MKYRRDLDGKRHKVVVHNGIEGFEATVTLSCTGCTEFGDYMGNINGHPYDEKAGCHVGFGCEECGYTGKRRRVFWTPFAASIPYRNSDILEFCAPNNDH